MIVRSDGKGALLLITQPDHALLAGEIIALWNPEAFAPPSARTTVLHAIEEHDNGWREIDDLPKLNPASGKPFDFMTAPNDFKKEIWPRGVERLARSSPAAAALVAEHAVTLHHHRRCEPDWQEFFKVMDALRSKLLADCNACEGEARRAFERNFDLLQIGDVMSLVFCNAWSDPTESRGYRMSLDGDHISVSPDPFRGTCIRFSVRARAIPDRVYESNEDLQRAFRDGRVVTLEGSASGQ